MKRSRIQVITDMLMAIEEKGGEIGPTRLLYKANLSHVSMSQYLEELAGGGLIEERVVKGKKRYVLTEKGRLFLVEFRKFSSFAESFGL